MTTTEPEPFQFQDAQQRIENTITTQILSGNFEPGDTIKADYQGKSFVLERTAMPPATERVEA